MKDAKVEIVTHDLDDGRFLGHVVLVLAEFIHEDESVVDEACHAFAKSYCNVALPDMRGRQEIGPDEN